MFGFFRRWKAYQRDSAAQRNEVVDRLSQLTPLLGDSQLPGNPGGIFVKSTPVGTVVGSVSDFGFRHDFRLGKVVSGGLTSDDADYTDSRYWVKFVTLSGDRGTRASIADAFKGVNREGLEPYPATVTNLAEDGTHTLPTDGSRIVICWRQRDSAGNDHWVMSEGGVGAGGVLIQLTAQASGAGKYECLAVNAPTSDRSNSTALAASDLGSTTGSTTAWAWNLEEVGATGSTHILSLSGGYADNVYFVATRLYTNSDGTVVYVFRGRQPTVCSEA